MKLKLLFLIFINLTSLQTFAQDSLKYDLNKFTTPDIVRRRLDIVGEVSPHVYQNKLLFEPSLNLNYQQTTNTRKKISTFDITLFKYSTSNLSYKDQSHFISWGGSVGVFSALTISPFVGFGVGRVENLDDAMQAVYFINELKKKKILLRKLNQKELFSLSTFIAKTKNNRALNSKKLLVKEIGAIDSFLIANEIINNSDTLFAKKLYNKQLYNCNFGRSSGHQSEFIINPMINYELNNLKTLPNGGYNYGITGSYNYIYKKQFSLDWQQTISATGSTTFNKVNYYGPSEYLSYLEPYYYSSLNATLSGFYVLEYYPDYRNCIHGLIGQNFEGSRVWTENSRTSGFSSWTTFSLSFIHFFNPHLRSDIGYSLSKSLSTISYENYFNGGLSLALRYSFF